MYIILIAYKINTILMTIGFTNHDTYIVLIIIYVH